MPSSSPVTSEPDTDFEKRRALALLPEGYNEPTHINYSPRHVQLARILRAYRLSLKEIEMCSAEIRGETRRRRAEIEEDDYP